MPFTGSHPAAVLPLLGTPLPASALVLGSMAPDYPYYLPITTTSWPTHTAVGIVGIDLALGVAAWLLWHGVLSGPAYACAPVGLRRRLAGRVAVGLRPRWRARELATAVVALVVGAATHVGWDELTHPDRFGTAHVPALAHTWGPLAGYRWAQYASGLLGAGAIAGYVLAWWRRTPERDAAPSQHPWQPWSALLAVAAVAGVVGAVTAPGLRQAAFDGATVGGGAAAAVALVLAVGWHVRRLAGGPADQAT
jgi:hypothetical protein